MPPDKMANAAHVAGAPLTAPLTEYIRGDRASLPTPYSSFFRCPFPVCALSPSRWTARGKGLFRSRRRSDGCHALVPPVRPALVLCVCARSSVSSRCGVCMGPACVRLRVRSEAFWLSSGGRRTASGRERLRCPVRTSTWRGACWRSPRSGRKDAVGLFR